MFLPPVINAVIDSLIREEQRKFEESLDGKSLVEQLVMRRLRERIQQEADEEMRQFEQIVLYGDGKVSE